MGHEDKRRGYFVIMQHKGRICLRMGSTEQERRQDRELKNNLWALNPAARAASLPVDFSTSGEPINNLFCLRHSWLGFLLPAIRVPTITVAYYLAVSMADAPLGIHFLLPKDTPIFTQLSLLSYSAHVSGEADPTNQNLGLSQPQHFFITGSGSGMSTWLITINTKTA